MVKQSITLVGVSVGVILFMSYAHEAIQYLVSSHDWISQVLTDVFSGGQAGNLARGFIALLSVPILVGLVPAIIYWMLRRHWFPFFMEIVWIVWLIQAGALIMMFKITG
jgi:hypothetical protein